MGINHFVEGNPSPVIISIQLPIEVKSFYDLKQVTYALEAIDKYLYTYWVKEWPNFKYRRYREVHLVHFQLSSPPEFKIFADPAWIAVFLTFLVGYKNLKENIHEISNDIGRIIHAIKGLTNRELQLLEIAVRLTLERLCEKGETEFHKLANKFGKARKALIGEDQEEIPKINVVDIDKDAF